MTVFLNLLPGTETQVDMVQQQPSSSQSSSKNIKVDSSHNSKEEIYLLRSPAYHIWRELEDTRSNKELDFTFPKCLRDDGNHQSFQQSGSISEGCTTNSCMSSHMWNRFQRRIYIMKLKPVILARKMAYLSAVDNF